MMKQNNEPIQFNYNIFMTTDLIQDHMHLDQKHVRQLFSEDYFYNVGDNPALKRFLQIESENHKDGLMLEYRTYFLDKNKRYFYHRNVQDVLQRDFKAITFPRALAVFGLTSAATYTMFSWLQGYLPFGKYGIRSIKQMPFYHNFGALGVLGVTLASASVLYVEWQTFKFTLHKFWSHVILGNRNWLHEDSKAPAYGEYYFHDDPMSCDQSFPLAARAILAHKKRDPSTYKGPYAVQGKNSPQSHSDQ